MRKNLKNGLFFLKTNYLLVLVIMTMLQACGGGKIVEPTIIPNDVAIVMAVDLKQISSKVTEFDDYFDVEFLQDILSNSEDSGIAAKLFKSGLDLNKPAYFFSKIDKGSIARYFGYAFKLKNAKSFEKTLKSIKNSPEIKSEGKIKYAMQKDLDRFIIAWKDDNALILASERDENLKKQALDILNTSKSEALESKNKEFRNTLRSNYDIAMWMDYQKILEAGAEDMTDFYLKSLPATMQGYTKMTKYVTANITFNKGNITMKSKTHLDDKLVKKYKFDKLIKDKIDNELVENLPIKEPIGMMSMGIGMDIVKNILDEAGYLKGTETAQKYLGVNNDEMFDMFSGDIVMALADMNLRSIMGGDYKFAIGLGIKNKKTLTSILDKVSILPFIKEKNSYYQIKRPGEPTIYLILKDNILYIVTDEDIKNDAISGKNKLDNQYVKATRNSTIGFHVNIQKLMNSFGNEYFDTNKSLQMVRDELKPESIIATSKPYRNGVTEAEMVFNVGNKKRNILAIIMDISKEAAKDSPRPRVNF